MSALADLAGYVTLPINSTLDLNTATVGQTGGDIRWDGTSILPQGAASLSNIGAIPLGIPTIGDLAQQVFILSQSTPAVGDLFVVRTNAGTLAWAQVFELDTTSISLWFYSYYVAPSGPVITQVQNNYGSVASTPANMPVAPGSLFLIGGSGLAAPGSQAALQDSTKGLPLTLNGASVSVTVNGVTGQPALYYATPDALAAVLPSDTPVGLGTLTVTYNGQSTVAPIQVAPSALGFATLNGIGYGQAVATDANYKSLGFTNSASPGQVPLTATLLIRPLRMASPSRLFRSRYTSATCRRRSPTRAETDIRVSISSM